MKTGLRYAAVFPLCCFLLCSVLMMPAAMISHADEIAVEDISPDDDTPDAIPSADDDSSNEDISGEDLFEDTGNDIIDTSGISEDAINGSEDSGNEDALIPGSELTLEAADSDRIAASLEDLTQTPSPTGSEGEMVIAEYIEEQMTSLGYDVQEQAFHEGVLNDEGIDPPGINIIADRGADSEENRTNNILLLVTHYDSKHNPLDDDPYANDKTGAAALLECARVLSSVTTDTDVCFLFLSGQEDGGYGAQNFIESLSDENRNRISTVIAVERIGYNTGLPSVLGTPDGTSSDAAALMQRRGIEYTVDDARQSGQLDGLENQVLQVVSDMLNSESSEPSDGQKTESAGLSESDPLAISESGSGVSGITEAAGIPGGTEVPGLLDSSNLGKADEGNSSAGDSVATVDEEGDSSNENPSPGFSVPLAWTVLPDSSMTLKAFSDASFNIVRVTQYSDEMADLFDGSTDPQSVSSAENTVEASASTYSEGSGSQDSHTSFSEILSANTSSAADIYLSEILSTGNSDAITSGIQDGIVSSSNGSSSGNDVSPDDSQTEDGTSASSPALPAPDAAAIAQVTDVICMTAAEIMQ